MRSEDINFPATLAFHKGATAIKEATSTALSKALPANVKLQALTSNYESFNDGAYMLRLSHLYEAGEHPTLAVPVTIDLEAIFGKAGLKITSAVETTLTGNRPLAEVKKHQWKTYAPNKAVAEQLGAFKEKAFEERMPFTYPTVTIRPMEVRTFMATFE